MKMQGQFIFDSGASTCATSDPTLLRHIIYGQGIKATPAFGPAIESKATGLYGPLGLDIILMEMMKVTLISIFQLCNGGLSGSHNILLLTSEGMRCFSIESIREALALIDKLGVEITDLATRRCYLVYTKDRFAHELCAQESQII